MFHPRFGEANARKAIFTLHRLFNNFYNLDCTQPEPESSVAGWYFFFNYKSAKFQWRLEKTYSEFCLVICGTRHVLEHYDYYGFYRTEILLGEKEGNYLFRPTDDWVNCFNSAYDILHEQLTLENISFELQDSINHSMRNLLEKVEKMNERRVVLR